MAILVYMNERGYCIDAGGGESTYVFDIPVEVEHDAAALYTFRWIVFNHAMEQLPFLCDATKDEDLVLHLDSRLVEEIKGDITPDNPFAKSSLKYFLVFDAGKFRRVDCRKCSSVTINNRLQLNDKPSRVTEGLS